MGQYAVCGQYPGAVPAGATVSLQCSGTNLPPARYVIVQFPITTTMNFCELDVCAKGSDLSIGCLILFVFHISLFCGVFQGSVLGPVGLLFITHTTLITVGPLLSMNLYLPNFDSSSTHIQHPLHRVFSRMVANILTML